jgi:excisionase family DNA binding protein
MGGEWMSAEETASSLQITKATLYKLVREGRVPARKSHGRWLFLASDIEELFSLTATAARSPAPGGSSR